MQDDERKEIHEDLHHLAGSLPHRGACTESEKAAAEYIASRFEEITGDAGQQPFDAPANYMMYVATYYFEFVLVAIVSLWYPWFACGYGLAAFVLYLAELSGYSAMSMFLPKHPSQNVVAQLLADRPRRLIIVAAHYDTGYESSLSDPRIQGWLRPLHLIVVCGMVAVVAACVVRALNGDTAAPNVADAMQIMGLFVLMAGAGFLIRSEMRGTDVRGAKGNAAGVAALLALAKRLQSDRIEDADIWFVATGAHEAGLYGMRHLLRQDSLDREETYIIALDYIGDAALHTIESEGMVFPFRTANRLRRAARECDATVTPIRPPGAPTDLLLPLARGFKAIGITSANEEGVQSDRLRGTDTLARVEARDVIPTVTYTERLVRRIARFD